MTAERRYTLTSRLWAVHALLPRYPGWNRVDTLLYLRAYKAYAVLHPVTRG